MPSLKVPSNHYHSGAKMMSPWGKLTALACHSTKRVNKAG